MLISALGGLLAAPLAHAAVLDVTVTDLRGEPLADAVVMVAPAQGRAPVRAMAPVEISQARRQFQPAVTVVTVGTAVSFPNFDTVRHHVYSFSPAKTFELKLYAGVPATPIVFDKPGVVSLGCNIHDQMVAWVLVVDTPWHARTDAQGRVQFDSLPAGSYQLRAWHSGVPIGSEPAPVAVALGAAAGTAQLRLATQGSR